MNEVEGKLTPVQRFRRLLWKERKAVYRVYGLAIFSGLVNLSLPLGIQAIINLIQGGQVSTSWIILVAVVILGVLGVGILQLAQMRITENIQQRIFTKSAFEMAIRIPRIKLESLYDHYAPELMNRFFDTLTVQKGLNKILIDFSTASLQVIFGLVLLSLYHPVFFIFSVFLVFSVYVIFWLTGKRGLSTSLNESKFKYKVAHWLQELARTNHSFKLAGETDLPLVKADVEVSGYLERRENHFRVLILQYRLLIAFKILVTAGLLIIGSLLVINQQLNIGQFVAAEIIILLIVGSIEKLIVSLETVYDVLTALEKMGQVVDLTLEENKGIVCSDNKSIGYKLDLENIEFSYPGQLNPTIRQLSMSLSPGENVCLRGPNGSGKSTLLHLISGAYRIHAGYLSLDDVPIDNYDLRSLRSSIGYDFSNSVLFDGTLRENITMGRGEISFERIQFTAENLGLTAFVRSLPMGYETSIQSEGLRLPRSVKQKILLARAVVHNPRLLLLEDPVEHIENQERHKITRFLMDKSHPWTIVMTTAHEDLVQYCDRTIEMSK